MELYQQSQPDSDVRELRNKGNASLEFTARIPYHPVIQSKHQCSASEDAEFDSKSVQTPSLSVDDSSRASSINNPESHSEADDTGCWVPHDDGHALFLKRSSSPVSMEELNLHRTPMDLGTLQDRRTCGAQQGPNINEVWSTSINKERDVSVEPQLQKLICSSEHLLMSSALGKSTALIPQPTLTSELSDSDSDSEEDSDSDDIDNDEWSGANDNIEAALYEAVFPDIDLAAHMVSTMYPILVLSYRKKITRKVSSWQERNIITCGTSSEGASTTKETAPQVTSKTGIESSPKRDRQSSSSDDNIGDDEDDNGDEFGRKRPKEQSDSDPEIPKPRFACPFFKKDPVKYSAAESGRKSCSGPGWLTIPQMKEHLNRAHRPVQCERCYHKFPFKNGDRASAVSERRQHIQQEDRCPRRPDSLKEGISDDEWSRLSEEKKKKNRKGKSKRDVTTPEQTQSPFEQWYEIWAVLCPDIPRPSTPWYTPLHSHGLRHNEHFLNVCKRVNEFKLAQLKEAIHSGSDDRVLSLLLECDQRKFQLYRSTFMVISGTTTDSFSNIEENDLGSSNTSGLWLKVAKNIEPQQSSSQLATNPPLPVTDFATPASHSTPVLTSDSAEAVMGGTEISMNENPQTLASNNIYALENIHVPAQQMSSVAAPTPLFQGKPVTTHNNHSARAGMDMDRNPQIVSQNTTYVGTSQAHYDYDASRFIPTSQAAYPNTSTESFGHVWSPDIYDMQVPGDYNMPIFPPADTPLQNHQWADQFPTPTSRQFPGAP